MAPVIPLLHEEPNPIADTSRIEASLKLNGITFKSDPSLLDSSDVEDTSAIVISLVAGMPTVSLPLGLINGTGALMVNYRLLGPERRAKLKKEKLRESRELQRK